MLRTLLSLSVVAIIATALIAAVRSNNVSSTAGSEACPCGQCDVACTCCTDPDVDCGDCGCESCGCEACLTNVVAACCATADSTGEAACCAAKTAEADESATPVTTAVAACPCGQCEVGCTCCSSDDVACEDCECESCGCEACAVAS